MRKITPKQAGNLLGMDAQTVRVMMQTKSIDIGIVTKRKGRTHYRYDIFPSKLASLLGITESEVLSRI